jgi:hypothetical protein
VSESGAFAAPELPQGPTQLVVTPPLGSGLSVARYDLEVLEGDVYWIVSAPLPANLFTQGWTGIEVTPSSLSLRVGEAADVRVRLLGGAPPAIVPSYLVRGTMGVINARGRFSALRAGRGSLRVVAGPYSKILPIQVQAAD